MCGRFAQALAPSEYIPHLQRHYPSLNVNQWATETDQDCVQPRYNVPPRSNAAVIRKESGSNVLRVMNWGVVPHWTKQPPAYADGLKTINARSETLIDPTERSALWMSLAPSKRCIIPVQGFYEWLNKGGKGPGSKAPYYTRNPAPAPRKAKQPDGSKVDTKAKPEPDSDLGANEEAPMLMFAGLWDECTFTGSNTPFRTFTILTTRSSPRLAFLHSRMPCLLRTDSEMNAWLACEPGSDAGQNGWNHALGGLLRPFGENEDDLVCYAVPLEVGKVGNQDASFVRPVTERKDGIESLFRKQKSKQVDRASPLERPAKEAANPVPSGKRKAEEDPLDVKRPKVVVLKDEDDEVIVLDHGDEEDEEVKEEEEEEKDMQGETEELGSIKASEEEIKSAKTVASKAMRADNAVIKDDPAVEPGRITDFFPRIN